MINVTKTYLPDKSKFKGYIDRIYESGWLTNNGQFVQELEKRLAEYLGVENLMVTANGTIALQIAFRALGIEGKSYHHSFHLCCHFKQSYMGRTTSCFCRYRQRDF